jgi:3-oxoadipate enol-lactonase
MSSISLGGCTLQTQRFGTDGSALCLHSCGEGPPLVLLHSLLADRASFERVVQALSRRFRVLLADLPGFGASDPAPGGLHAVADRVAAGLRLALGDARPTLLGNGYGGFVALLTAIRHPDRVRSLVLADCGAAFDEPGRAAFVGMARAAGASGLQAVADVAMRRLFAPEFQARNPELIERCRQRFLATPAQTFQEACAALSTLDLREGAAGLKLPTLVLVGEHDEATPPPMARELAGLMPDARLRVLEGCAHVPQLQAPQAFLAELDAFLGAPAARAGVSAADA